MILRGRGRSTFYHPSQIKELKRGLGHKGRVKRAGRRSGADVIIMKKIDDEILIDDVSCDHGLAQTLAPIKMRLRASEMNDEVSLQSAFNKRRAAFGTFWPGSAPGI